MGARFTRIRRRTLLLGAALVGLTVAFGQSQSATAATTCNVSWDGGGDGTTWSNGLNWSSNLVPTASQIACIKNDTQAWNVVLDVDTTVRGVVLGAPGNVNTQTLTIGNGSGPVTLTTNVASTTAPGVEIDPGGVLTMNSSGNHAVAVNTIGTNQKVLVNGGRLNVHGAGTRSVTPTLEVAAGTVDIANGQRLTFTGANQTFRQSGGTVALNTNGEIWVIDGATFDYTGGTSTGTGRMVSYSATLKYTGAGASTATGTWFIFTRYAETVTTGGTIPVNHTIQVTGDYYAGATLTAANVTNKGTIILTDDTCCSTNAILSSPTGTFTNSGTLRTLQNSGPRYVQAKNFVNTATGLIDVNETVDFSFNDGTAGIITNNGTITLYPGKTFRVQDNGLQTFKQNAGTINLGNDANFEVLSAKVIWVDGVVTRPDTERLNLWSSTLDYSTATAQTGSSVRPFMLSRQTTMLGNVPATHELHVVGHHYDGANLHANASYTNNGTIILTDDACCGTEARLTQNAGTLTNNGTIRTSPNSSHRYLNLRNLINNGTLDIDANTDLHYVVEEPSGSATYVKGSTVNNGTIDIAPSVYLAIPDTGHRQTFTQNAGGVVLGDNADFHLLNVQYNFVAGTVGHNDDERIRLRRSTLNYTNAAATANTSTRWYGIYEGSTLVGNVPANHDLRLNGEYYNPVTLTSSAAVVNNGTITLASVDTCQCQSGATLASTAGLFTNNGTITMDSANGSWRNLALTSMRNNGTFNVNKYTELNTPDGVWTNAGTINIADGIELKVTSQGTDPQQFIQESGAISIAGNGVMSLFFGTFKWIDGTITGTRPVYVEGSTVDYTGALASANTSNRHFQLIGNSTLLGNVPANHTLRLTAAYYYPSILTSATAFTNNGTIILENGACGGCGTHAQLQTTTGVLTNNGTFHVDDGGNGRTLSTNGFTNNGTMTIEQDLTLSALDAIWTNAGTINLSSGAHLILPDNGNQQWVQQSGSLTFGSTSSNIHINSGTLKYVGGSITPSTNELPHLENSVLDYSAVGPSPSAVELRFRGGSNTVLGNVPAGHTLHIAADYYNPGVLTSATAFTNGGTIILENITCGGCGTHAQLLTTTGALTNDGTLVIEAGGNGRLLSTSGLTNNGTVTVKQDIEFTANGATWTNNGTINVLEGAHIIVPANNNQRFVQNAGAMSFGATNSNLRIYTGTFEYNGGTISQGADLIYLESSTLDYTDAPQTAPSAADIRMVSGASVLLGDVPANHKVRIGGEYYWPAVLTAPSSFANRGTILFERVTCGGCSTSMTLNVTTGTLTNLGTITTDTSGEGKTINGSVQNAGIITPTSALSISDLDNLSGGTLTGGVYILQADLYTPGGTVTTNAANIQKVGAATFRDTSTGNSDGLYGQLTANSGVLTLDNSQLQVPTFVNTGQVVLKNGSDLATTAGSYVQNASTSETPSSTILQDSGTSLTASNNDIDINAGILGGVGSVAGTTTLDGTLQPGLSPGTLTLNALTMNPSSTLAMELAGLLDAERDRLVVTNAAVLDGTLALTTTAPFTPTLGDLVTMVTGATVTGTFDTVTGDDLAGGTQYWSVGYTPTSMTLLVKNTPHLTIGDVEITEPNDGTATATFTVTLSETSTRAVAFDALAAAGGAKLPDDFTFVPQLSAVIPAGSLTAQVSATILADTLDEPTEAYAINVSNPVKLIIDDGVAAGTILDDAADLPPTANVTTTALSVDVEGSGVPVPKTVTVELSAPSGYPTITVPWSTADGTALSARNDYTPGTGNLVFNEGETSKTFDVAANGDLKDEDDETFTASIASGDNFVLGTTTATVTIVDDDLAPTVTISPATVTVAEPNTGTVNATFNVTLSGASGRTITVPYSATANTAVTPADYSLTAASLSYPEDTVTQSVSVVVNADALDENNENGKVVLGSPTNATLLSSPQEATFVITDDPADTPPRVFINNPSTTEGTGGSKNLTFTVSLTAPSGKQIQFTAATVGGSGTATAGTDYTAKSQAFTFAAGTTSAPFAVALATDAVDEFDETFTVQLTPTSNVTTGAASQGTGTITDDDAPASLAVGDVTFGEPEMGSANVTVPVTLTGATAKTVTVDYSTATGTATAADFLAASGSLTFNPGETSKDVVFPVNGDPLDEETETFTLNLSNVANGAIGDAAGTITITDDAADGPVTVSVEDVEITETDVDQVVQVPVILEDPSGRQVQVAYDLNPGSASAADFVDTSGTLTFAAGETTKHVAVTVVGDNLVEAAENLSLDLSSPVNAVFGVNPGRVNILNDDFPPPSLSIGNAYVREPASGSSELVYTVTRTGVLTDPTSVSVTVGAESVAFAGGDYQSAGAQAFPRSVSFAAGEATKTVVVLVKPDTNPEWPETLLLQLTNPTNAVVTDGLGEGVISDDDPGAPATISVSDVVVDEGAGNATVTVVRNGSSTEIVSVSAVTSKGSIAGVARAGAASDYTVTSRSNAQLNFLAGETTKTFNVPILDDARDEPNEQFAVHLKTPLRVKVSDAIAYVTIVDNDGAANPAGPSSWVAPIDTRIVETQAGQSAVVTLARTGDISSAATVNVATAPIGTAGQTVAANDYDVRAAAPVSFDAGAATTTVTIGIRGDAVPEAPDTLLVRLTAPSTGLTIVDEYGEIIIVDNDAGTPATISISDATVIEGNAGTTTLVFTVTRHGYNSDGETVRLATVAATGPGFTTATAGSDFVATDSSARVDFAAGETTKTFSVTVNGDTTDTTDEHLFLVITSTTRAPVADNTGIGTIVNDD